MAVKKAMTRRMTEEERKEFKDLLSKIHDESLTKEEVEKLTAKAHSLLDRIEAR